MPRQSPETRSRWAMTSPERSTPVSTQFDQSVNLFGSWFDTRTFALSSDNPPSFARACTISSSAESVDPWRSSERLAPSSKASSAFPVHAATAAAAYGNGDSVAESLSTQVIFTSVPGQRGRWRARKKAQADETNDSPQSRLACRSRLCTRRSHSRTHRPGRLSKG